MCVVYYIVLLYYILIYLLFSFTNVYIYISFIFMSGPPWIGFCWFKISFIASITRVYCGYIFFEK
jgi:hypothetical protein